MSNRITEGGIRIDGVLGEAMGLEEPKSSAMANEPMSEVPPNGGGDPVSHTEAHAQKPSVPKKTRMVDFSRLQQQVAGISAEQEREDEYAAYTESVREFIILLPNLSDKLIAAQYQKGGQDRVIQKEILERTDLEPPAQYHVRTVFMERLALYGIGHQGVPNFDTVIRRAVHELELFVKEESGAASGKKSKRDTYIIGEENYTLSPKVSVSAELRKFVELKVVPALNALYRLSAEKARKERESEQQDFMSGVTISPVELYTGVPGIAIIDFPPRQVQGFNPKTRENYTMMQPGGQGKVRSDGQDVWALDARFSQKFVERMGRVIQGAIRIALCDIPENPPLQFTDQEKRELSDETKQSMRWFHGALFAHWDKLEIMRKAREHATITPEEFVLRPSVGGMAFFHLKTFRWEHTKNDGTKIKRHYADLWGLLLRGADGVLILEEYDPYAFGLLDECMGAVKAGEKFAGVKNPLQTILKIWSGIVAKEAKEVTDPKRQEEIRQWVEEGRKVSGRDQAREDYLASLSDEDRERALSAEQEAKSGDDEPTDGEIVDQMARETLEGLQQEALGDQIAHDAGLPESGSSAQSASASRDGSAEPEVAPEKSSGSRKPAKPAKVSKSPRKSSK